MSILKGLKKALGKFLSNAGKSLTRSDYVAAGTTGKNQLWSPQTKSGDAIARTEGKKIRERVKWLERNDPHVQGAVRRLISNTVGEGNFPQSKVRLPDGTGLNKDIADMIEQPFLEWAEMCCMNGDGLPDIQGYNQRAKVVDGQSFVVMSQVKNILKLQAIEADQLCSEVDGQLPNGNQAIRGIEVDLFGKPVAYHFYDVHPGDNSRFWTKVNRIPADRVLHSFERNRASTAHGISIFAAVVMNLYDIGELSDATMTLSRLAAAYGIIVKTPTPEDYINGPATVTRDESSLIAGARQEYINPGGFHYLRPDEEATMVKPDQPGPVYEPFMRYNLRTCAVGIGQSYSQFAGDYSQGSYSSERQAMILERALFRMENAQMDRRFNLPMFRKWLDLEVLSGRITLADYEKNRWNYQRVRFSRPKMEYVNPVQEIQALVLERDNNMKSLTEIIEDRGMDRDDTFNTIADDEAALKALGIWKAPKGAGNGF